MVEAKIFARADIAPPKNIKNRAKLMPMALMDEEMDDMLDVDGVDEEAPTPVLDRRPSLVMQPAKPGRRHTIL